MKLEKNDIRKIKNLKVNKRLSDGQIDFYTSFPIPIIRREDLVSQYNKETGCIYHMDKISFFVMFNHHLLDEASLSELLSQKQAELDKADKLLQLNLEFKNVLSSS